MTETELYDQIIEIEDKLVDILVAHDVRGLLFKKIFGNIEKRVKSKKLL